MHRFSRVLASAIALLLALSACASQPSQSPVAVSRNVAGPTSKADRPTGKVILDASSLLGAQTSGTRQTLAYGLDPVKFPITHLRLSVFYPGMPLDPDSNSSSPQPVVLTETPVVWTTTGVTKDGKPTVPSGFITATAHAGPNRVFTVEALSGTRTLMRMKAAASIAADGTATIKLNFLEDAIGRTIEALIDEQRKSFGAYRVLDDEEPPFQFPVQEWPFMYTDDLVEPLRVYLTDLTGFNPATNTYRVDRPAPQYLRVERLAEELFQDKGIGWLSDPSGPLASDMRSPFTRNTDQDATDHYILLSMMAGDDFDETKGAEYRVSIIAPTTNGWMPVEHTNQPFVLFDLYNFGDPTYTFKTRNLPAGRHLLVLNKPDGTVLYRILEVDNDGIRPGELL
ncbi:hypothetical protein D3C72_562170 [compost metagenome]